jgi:hypothetical protein
MLRFARVKLRSQGEQQREAAGCASALRPAGRYIAAKLTGQAVGVADLRAGILLLHDASVMMLQRGCTHRMLSSCQHHDNIAIARRYLRGEAAIESTAHLTLRMRLRECSVIASRKQGDSMTNSGAFTPQPSGQSAILGAVFRRTCRLVAGRRGG